MSTKVKDNGGQAFPRTAFNGDGDVTTWDDEFLGMTLRDYFAAEAMKSLLCEIDQFPDENWRIGVAKDAYAMADAMLEVRQS